MSFGDSVQLLVNPFLDIKEKVDEEFSELNGFLRLLLLVPYLVFSSLWVGLYSTWYLVSIPLAIVISIVTFPFSNKY